MNQYKGRDITWLGKQGSGVGEGRRYNVGPPADPYQGPGAGSSWLCCGYCERRSAILNIFRLLLRQEINDTRKERQSCYISSAFRLSSLLHHPPPPPPPVRLFVFTSVGHCLCVCLSVCMSVCLCSLSLFSHSLAIFCLSVGRSASVSPSLSLSSACYFFFLFLSVCLSVCLSICPSVCPSVCLSVRLSVCVSSFYVRNMRLFFPCISLSASVSLFLTFLHSDIVLFLQGK